MTELVRLVGKDSVWDDQKRILEIAKVIGTFLGLVKEDSILLAAGPGLPASVSSQGDVRNATRR